MSHVFPHMDSLIQSANICPVTCCVLGSRMGGAGAVSYLNSSGREKPKPNSDWLQQKRNALAYVTESFRVNWLQAQWVPEVPRTKSSFLSYAFFCEGLTHLQFLPQRLSGNDGLQQFQTYWLSHPRGREPFPQQFQ